MITAPHQDEVWTVRYFGGSGRGVSDFDEYLNELTRLGWTIRFVLGDSLQGFTIVGCKDPARDSARRGMAP